MPASPLSVVVARPPAIPAQHVRADLRSQRGNSEAQPVQQPHGLMLLLLLLLLQCQIRGRNVPQATGLPCILPRTSSVELGVILDLLDAHWVQDAGYGAPQRLRVALRGRRVFEHRRAARRAVNRRGALARCFTIPQQGHMAYSSQLWQICKLRGWRPMERWWSPHPRTCKVLLNMS